MTNQFKKITDALKNIHLSKKESEKMHDTITEYMKHFPIGDHNQSIISPLSSKYAWGWRLIPITVVMVIMIIGNVPNGKMTEVFNTSVMEQVEMETNTEDFAYKTMAPRYYDTLNDITDTREFLKLNYSSNIKTRNVSRIIREVGLLVQQVSGRIDNVNDSEKYGYISFVIPKNNFFEFKSEIEEITNKKLIVENTSSSNLLYQKQDIEQRMENEEESLSELRQKKINLDNFYKQQIKSIEAQITTLESQIQALKITIENTGENDQGALNLLRQQLATSLTRLTTLQGELSKANKDYRTQINQINSQIERAERNITNLNEEDISLINNVETVDGYINVRWVNLWELSNELSPTPMWLNISALVLLVWWILERKGRWLYAKWRGIQSKEADLNW